MVSERFTKAVKFLKESQEHDKKVIPPYFYFYTKYCDFFNLLTEEQAGKTIKYICNYVQQKQDLPTVDQLDNTSIKMLIEIIKQDIDNAFRKYRAQCENGKKGGAPKGNQNAKKNKSNTDNILDNLTIDKINEELSLKIIELYYQADKEKFEIDKFYNKSQIALIISCYQLIDFSASDNFEYFGFEYKTLKEYTLNESAIKFCKELKALSLEWYEDKESPQYKTFSVAFADYKQRAIKILEFPIKEIEKFNDMCTAVFDCEFFSENELLNLFTKDEIITIKGLRKTTQKQPKNNPKQTN